MSVYDLLVAWNETFIGKKSSGEPAMLNSIEPVPLFESMTGNVLANQKEHFKVLKPTAHCF